MTSARRNLSFLRSLVIPREYKTYKQNNVRLCSTLAGWDPTEFRPRTAVVLTKVSRYEFEKLQNEQLTEKQLEDALTKV